MPPYFLHEGKLVSHGQRVMFFYVRSGSIH